MFLVILESLSLRALDGLRRLARFHDVEVDIVDGGDRLAAKGTPDRLAVFAEDALLDDRLARAAA